MIADMLDSYAENHLWFGWLLNGIGLILIIGFLFLWIQDFIEELNNGSSIINSVFNREAIVGLFLFGTIMVAEAIKWLSVGFWDFVVKVI